MSETSDIVIASEAMTLRRLYPAQIFRNDESLTLREVDQDSISFNNLVKSIRTPRVDDDGRQVSDHGLLNPIAVRPLPGQEGKYALVDGLHRFTAWKIAFGDSKPIPCSIINLSEVGVVKAQIQANALKVETKKASYANALLRLMDAFPNLTINDLAEEISIEPNTLRTWLTLPKLPKWLQDKVDAEEFPVSVGYILAKFTEPKVNKDTTVKNFWDSAQKEWYEYYGKIKDEATGLNRWMSEAAVAIKKLKKERRDGRQVEGSAPGDLITPVLRSKRELEVEMERVQEDVETSPVTFDESSMTENEKASFTAAYQRGYLSALQYTLSVDDETFNARKTAKDDASNARKAAKEERKAGKKADTVARSTGLFGMFHRKLK